MGNYGVISPLQTILIKNFCITVPVPPQKKSCINHVQSSGMRCCHLCLKRFLLKDTTTVASIIKPVKIVTKDVKAELIAQAPCVQVYKVKGKLFSREKFTHFYITNVNYYYRKDRCNALLLRDK